MRTCSFGLFGGAFFAMVTVVAAELWGPMNVAPALPVRWFRLDVFGRADARAPKLVNLFGIPGTFACAPIFAAIVAQTGGYEQAIFFAAAMVTIAFLCVAFIQFDGSIDSALVSPPMPTSSSASPRLSTLRANAANAAANEVVDVEKPAAAREIVRA